MDRGLEYSLALKGKVLSRGGRDLGRFLRFIRFRVWLAGDIDNSTSMPNYCDGRYGNLGIYTNEDPSACTEVWSIPWPSRTSITTPWGRDLGRLF